MESSTSIKVTVSGSVTVKLYFDGASKSFKLNGSSKTTSSSGTWSGGFTSGTLTITKGDSMNLYAIEISSSSNSLSLDFDDATAISTVDAEAVAKEGKKIVKDGKLVISKGGKFFDIAGKEL
jgi:hypothetical protein